MVRNAELQIEADLLRQKEQEYLEILNGSTEASWIHDNTTDLLVYSHEWKQRIGGEHVPDEEMIRYATSLVHPDDIDRVIKVRHSIFANMLSKYATEYRFRIVSGEYIWVYDQGKIIYNDEGAPVKIYGTSMDITKRKTSEEELKQADRNKNEFLHTLSHELRNPLAAIVAGFSLLNLTDDPKKTARAKSIIQRQIAQLTRLVDDMLDITRITNNKIKLQKEQIDLVSLVASVAEDNHLLMDNKGIHFEVNLDSQPITIDADPARIRQIIGNLLQNAAKFTDRGGSVKLSVFRDPQEAVIQVQDSGIGIQPEFLDQMFVPFQQVSSSNNRNEGGLGLGLSIVKSIVELHGGNAQVFSEGLEKGATFIVRLPAKPD